MKKFSIFILMMIASVLSSLGAGIVPRECSIGSGAFLHPLKDVGLYFDYPIKVLNNAQVSVLCNGSVVASTDSLTVENYKDIQGILTITFDEQLLPRGRNYVLTITPNTIARENGEDANELISIEFAVPSTLGAGTSVNQNSSSIETVSSLGFEWPYETSAVGSPEMVLYREDEAVRSYFATVSYDWDLGFAMAYFDKPLSFEKDVHYRLVLPAGSVSSYYRNDIVSDESVYEFVGASVATPDPITYTWCSLIDNPPKDCLNEVRFYYDKEVKLSANPKVKLYEGDVKTLVKEVVPTLAKEGDNMVLTADFGGFALTSTDGYCVVIPEGTLITVTGDVVVNKSNKESISGKTSVETIPEQLVTVEAASKSIIIKNASLGSKVNVYMADGRLAKHVVIGAETEMISVSDVGVYIIDVDGLTSKVIVSR